MASKNQVVLSRRLTIEITLGDMEIMTELLGVLSANYASSGLQFSQYYNGLKSQWVIKVEFFDENCLDVEEFVRDWCEQKGMAVDMAKPG